MVYFPVSFTTLACHQSGFPVARFRRLTLRRTLLHAPFSCRAFASLLAYGIKGWGLKRIPLLLSSRCYLKNVRKEIKIGQFTT